MRSLYLRGDRAYELAGLHLFNDGRLHSQVTPGDLYKLLTDEEFYRTVGCQVPRKV